MRILKSFCPFYKCSKSNGLAAFLCTCAVYVEKPGLRHLFQNLMVLTESTTRCSLKSVPLLRMVQTDIQRYAMIYKVLKIKRVPPKTTDICSLFSSYA
jgi:hypothetical protein